MSLNNVDWGNCTRVLEKLKTVSLADEAGATKEYKKFSDEVKAIPIVSAILDGMSIDENRHHSYIEAMIVILEKECGSSE